MEAWRTIAEHLARSEASFRAVIEGSPEGICVHHHGRIVFANPAFAEMLAWHRDVMLGASVIDRIHPDDRPRALERIRRLHAGESSHMPMIDVRLVRLDGGEVIASVTGIRVELEGVPCVVALCRDVTAERRLQARLVEADRMVALGTLSAGIAHEINNPLTYVILHLEAVQVAAQRLRGLVCEEARGVIDRLAESAVIARDGASRVRDIVRDLRVFSRTSGDVQAPVDLRPTIERALAITGHEVRSRATVVTELGELPRVLASDGRLTQVFVNLLINAAQAIGRGDPQQHRIEVRAWREGDAARVSVRDTGAGIAAEHLPRIFEPFFTTKPVGEGSGLGLAIAHGIVTDAGGAIEVTSALGRGTTVVVTLPVSR